MPQYIQNMQNQESTKNQFSVSQLVEAIDTSLKELGKINVTGEVSDIKISKNGHTYFTLKDEKSYIKVIYFNATKYKRTGTPVQLVNGIQVRIIGEIVTSRSAYAIKVISISKRGTGTIMEEIEACKNKLLAMGLFESSKKRIIPNSISIQKIGIVTSSDGAVAQDIITRVKDRFPKELIVYDSFVQGANAVATIVQGIQYLQNKALSIDVIIVARGGGSLEDLMPFNSEEVAITIANSRVPVISAVGHQTDYTIADLAADLRASTPTMAAEIITTPTIEEVEQYVRSASKFLQTSMEAKINILQQHTNHATQSLTKIPPILQNYTSTIGGLQNVMHLTMDSIFNRQASHVELILNKLDYNKKTAIIKIQQTEERLKQHQQRTRIVVINSFNKANKTIQQFASHTPNIINIATTQAGIIRNIINKLTYITNNKLQNLQLNLSKQKQLLPVVQSSLLKANAKLALYKQAINYNSQNTINKKTAIVLQMHAYVQQINYNNFLKRGFVVLRDNNSTIIKNSTDFIQTQPHNIQFRDGTKTFTPIFNTKQK